MAPWLATCVMPLAAWGSGSFEASALIQSKALTVTAEDEFDMLLDNAKSIPIPTKNDDSCAWELGEPKSGAGEVFDYYVELTAPVVKSRTINIEQPADGEWYGVAVLLLIEGIKQPTARGYGISLVGMDAEYAVKSVMHYLGPKWALQIFHGPGTKDSIEQALGHPRGVIWQELPPLAHPFKDRMQVLEYYNPLLWSAENFWKQIPHRFEHVLLFHTDSIIFRPLCVNKFLMYDHIGAPERLKPDVSTAICPYNNCMNGGFNLRSRSAVLDAISDYGFERAKDAVNKSEQPHDFEDWMYTAVLRNMNKAVAPRAVAELFSMETYTTGNPVCAMHQAADHITDKAMWSALSQMSEWHDVLPAMRERFPGIEAN